MSSEFNLADLKFTINLACAELEQVKTHPVHAIRLRLFFELAAQYVSSGDLDSLMNRAEALADEAVVARKGGWKSI